MSHLDALSKIIVDSVAAVQSECTARGTTYPSLDVPPSPETDGLQMELAALAAPAIAAAYQLIATLQHSRSYVVGMGFGALYTGGLMLTEAAFVPDILREAGPKGLHINDIASVRNVDPNKLGRTMRLLATRHVYEEVSPDVFRSNRISERMCTGKSVKGILESPDDRWVGSNGLAAGTAMCGDQIIVPLGVFVDHLLDPATGFSEEPNVSAFGRAHKTDLTFYDYLDLPGQELQRKRFGIAMAATTPSDDSLANQGFDWASLPKGSKVVDVGGGVGNLTMTLAKVHKHLRYTVQDRPGTVSEGEALWKETMPGYIESGAVQLQGHDFFEEQPIKDATVFVTRYTTHNWSDKYARRFLTRLREAARPDTKLVVLDDIVDYLCRGAGGAEDIPGVAKTLSPEPLLPYAESATSHVYCMDLGMMLNNNCQERTIGQFIALFTSAGWKLERVYRLHAPLPSQLVCVPL